MHLRCRFLPLLWLSAALILAPVNRAIGLASDKEQPAVVTADRSEYSEQLQQQTLIGNVLIVQGSLRVRADVIVIGLVEGALDSVDASGRPAIFEQLDDARQRVTGQATRVLYSATSDQLQLVGDARLTNPSQSLSGDRIDYNMDTQAATAQGGKDQVNIVIKPQQSDSQ